MGRCPEAQRQHVKLSLHPALPAAGSRRSLPALMNSTKHSLVKHNVPGKAGLGFYNI